MLFLLTTMEIGGRSSKRATSFQSTDRSRSVKVPGRSVTG